MVDVVIIVEKRFIVSVRVFEVMKDLDLRWGFEIEKVLVQVQVIVGVSNIFGIWFGLYIESFVVECVFDRGDGGGDLFDSVWILRYVLEKDNIIVSEVNDNILYGFFFFDIIFVVY